jgi:hypothetical protein
MLAMLIGAGSWTPLVLSQPLGHPGGPEPRNLDSFMEELDAPPYQLELLLSFGTSKGGSAGHLALAFRDQAGDDDLVYSANFYADRAPEHAKGHYIRDLMCRIPKREYLYRTRSTLGEGASFGLDYGEVFKRAVIGVRLRNTSESDVKRLRAFCERLDADFKARKARTEYHPRPIVYDYMDLNCAKTIAVAFKYGLGWEDIAINGEGLSGIHLIKALKANIPSSTLTQIMTAAHARGWEMDVVLYKKFVGSTYVNPHDEDGTPYTDLPNRFPSVLSIDFQMEQGRYEDYDNLRTMHLLYQLGRAIVVFDPATVELTIERSGQAAPWDLATAIAHDRASRESKNVFRRLLFRAWGIRLEGPNDQGGLYDGETQGRVDFQGLMGTR